MTKDNKNNKRYDKEEKENLIRRMLPPESISPTNLSIETGISKSTLATWKSKALVNLCLDQKEVYLQKKSL